MIVRERNDQFVMIEQHHHASISGMLFTYLKEDFVTDLNWKDDIEFAIFQHDCGWVPFDKAPFWDDKGNAPYSFTNFPKKPKTVLYEHGINKVEDHSLYAALLCSKHYTSFLKKDSTPLAIDFIENEKNRQERLKKKIIGFNEKQFSLHYELIKFFDDLSLYICLNEPGVQKDSEHPFFKSRISLPQYFGGGNLHLNWASHNKLELETELFQPDLTVQLKQKVISKEDILKDGLQKTYRNTQIEKVSFKIV